MFKKLVSVFLILCLTAMPIFAEEQSAQSDIYLTINPDNQPHQIEIAVPIQIPIILNADGSTIISPDLKIQNKSSTVDVQLASLTVVATNGWQVKNFTDSFSQPGAKIFGLQFRGDNTNVYGSVNLTSSNWIIPCLTSLPLEVKAKFAPQDVDTQQSIGIGKLNYVFMA